MSSDRFRVTISYVKGPPGEPPKASKMTPKAPHSDPQSHSGDPKHPTMTSHRGGAVGGLIGGRGLLVAPPPTPAMTSRCGRVLTSPLLPPCPCQTRRRTTAVTGCCPSRWASPRPCTASPATSRPPYTRTSPSVGRGFRRRGQWRAGRGDGPANGRAHWGERGGASGLGYMCVGGGGGG